MKTIQPALASLLLSITASVLATWLLRRMLHVEPGGTNVPSDASVQVPVVVVPIVFAGNTFGSQVNVPRHGMARKFGRRRRHH